MGGHHTIGDEGEIHAVFIIIVFVMLQLARGAVETSLAEHGASELQCHSTE